MTKPIVLTIVSEKELPTLGGDSPYGYLKAFTAINAKLGVYSRGFGKVIDQIGAERHLWEYLTYNSVAKAKAAGAHWGKMCELHQIKVFHANQEAGTSGTVPYAKYPNPYECNQAFMDAFIAAAPTYTEIWYNGWSWAATSDGRKLHDTALIKQYDAWNPMNHGTSRSTIATYWGPDKRPAYNKCFRYRGTIPDLKVIPQIGVGRIDKEGKVWGFWDTYKKLLLTTPVDGVDFYFGNGAMPRMLNDHAQFHALVHCAEDLASDRRWCNAA
jgi:hypothetical protein